MRQCPGLEKIAATLKLDHLPAPLFHINFGAIWSVGQDSGGDASRQDLFETGLTPATQDDGAVAACFGFIEDIISDVKFHGFEFSSNGLSQQTSLLESLLGLFKDPSPFLFLLLFPDIDQTPAVLSIYL